MKKYIGYLLAGLLGAAIGSAIPVLHAQGGYSPELREIQVNGVKVIPKNGVINIIIDGGVAYNGNIVYITSGRPATN